MNLAWIGYVTGMLLALTPTGGFTTSDDAQTECESSAEMIFSYLRMPWLDGIAWLTHSAQSSEVEKVRTLIKSSESGEQWALQMLKNFSQTQREIRLKNIRAIESHDRHISNDTQRKNENEPAQCLGNAIKSNLVSDGLEVTADTSQASCEQTAFEYLNGEEILALFLISSVCAFMFACTMCDFVKRCRPRKVSTTIDTLAKFSLYTNAFTLLSTKTTCDTMPAIHGIRFLCCCVIIGGHHYVLLCVLQRHQINLLDLLEFKDSWTGVFLTAAPFTVDTFFVIGGFVTTYTFFMAKKSGMKFNLLTMYLRRYLRLTPCLVILMVIAITLYHRVGISHSWESSLPTELHDCRNKWWINLLYLQNIVQNDTMCFPQFWYLAVDMQLFWISPIILYPLYRRPNIGLAILSLFLIGSVTASTIMYTVNRYSNALLRFDMDFEKVFENTSRSYMSTVSHAFPYWLGILLGYEVATKKRCLTKVNLAINWVIAGSLALFGIWANYKVYNTNFAYDLRIETITACLSRPFWSVAIAWTIYACTQGYGGVATSLLSLPIFVPLSRLSYSLYTVHLAVQGYYITKSEVPATFSGLEILYGIVNELILSIALAIIFNLFIESPVVVLMNLLTNCGYKPKPTAIMVRQQLEKKNAGIHED